VRERADALTTRSYAPDVTVDQMCRLSRMSAALARTAAELEHALARHQKQPVPFFGTVGEDEVDIGGLDAVWCREPMQQSATRVPPGGGDAPDDAAPALVGEAAPNRSGAVPLAASAEPSPVGTGVPVASGPSGTDVAVRQIAPVDAATSIPAGAGSALHNLGSGVAAGAAA
jgi:hypothetical protein